MLSGWQPEGLLGVAVVVVLVLLVVVVVVGGGVGWWAWMAGWTTRVATMAMVVARSDRSCWTNSVSTWIWAAMLVT